MMNFFTKTFFAVTFLLFVSLSGVYAQDYTMEVYVGNPIYGRPSFQRALDYFNDYHGHSKKDALNLRAVSFGYKIGLQVSSSDGKYKVGFDYHWNNYKTNFGRMPNFNADGQLKFKYGYLGATAAIQLVNINNYKKDLRFPLYYAMGLYFGNQTSEYRLKGGDWQKQVPVGAPVYDKTGLILWDNGIQTEIPLYKFLYLYPKVGYQMHISGEKGVGGLGSYISPTRDNTKLLSRPYIEVLAAVRLHDLVK